MKGRSREAILASVEFASTVLVWIVLEKLIPDAEGRLVEAVSSIATALIAGFFTYLTVGLLFSRTVISARWIIENREVPGNLPTIGKSPGGVVNLHLKFVVDELSLALRVVNKISRTPLPVTIDILFDPKEAMVYQKQVGPRSRFVGNVLTMRCEDGLWVGDVAWVEFTATIKNSSSQIDRISINSRVRTPTRRYLAWAVVRCDLGKEGFLIGG